MYINKNTRNINFATYLNYTINSILTQNIMAHRYTQHKHKNKQTINMTTTNNITNELSNE